MQNSTERDIYEIYFTCTKTICNVNAYDGILLQNVSDAGARKLKAKVDPEGPYHDKRSGDSQHSPWRHLIYKLCYFKDLKQQYIDY